MRIEACNPAVRATSYENWPLPHASSSRQTQNCSPPTKDGEPLGVDEACEPKELIVRVAPGGYTGGQLGLIPVADDESPGRGRRFAEDEIEAGLNGTSDNA
jgi:hypothetical protein